MLRIVLCAVAVALAAGNDNAQLEFRTGSSSCMYTYDGTSVSSTCGLSLDGVDISTEIAEIKTTIAGIQANVSALQKATAEPEACKDRAFYYPLDTASGKAGAEARSGTALTAGKVGSAWRSSPSCHSGASFQTDLDTNVFTVAFWFNPNDFSCHRAGPNHNNYAAHGDAAGLNCQGLFWFDQNTRWGNMLRINSGHLCMGGKSYSNLAVGSRLSTGTWYHIAVVGDGTTIKTYLNGNLDMSMPQGGFKAGGQMWFANYGTTAGGRAGGGNCNQHFAKGSIDEVAGYSRAMTHTEVNEIYSAENGGQRICK